MQHCSSILMSLAVIVGAVPVVEASPPSPDELVEMMLEAAGGRDDFEALGLVRFDVEEQETLANGKQYTNSITMTVYAPNMDNSRLEFGEKAIVVRNEGDSWALVDGALDERPQALKMSRGTVNQKVFPMLLPFSLTMDGAGVANVVESEYDGTPSWRASLVVPPGFFIAPSMTGPWVIEVARDSGELLVAGVLPPESMRTVVDQGMRYHVLKTTEIRGVRLPTEILMEGISFQGVPTGHNRLVTLEPEVLGRFDPTLFVHPERLEAIEEGVP